MLCVSFVILVLWVSMWEGYKRRGRILECKCGWWSGGVAKVRPNLKGRAVSGSRRKGR